MVHRIFLVLFFGSFAHAAQWVQVNVEKAPVYADIDMRSPIGYVKKDKKVKVGEVTRNKGRLLPIIVSGKIAYIEQKNIISKEEMELYQQSRMKRESVQRENIRLNLVGFGATAIAGTLNTGNIVEGLVERNFSLIGGGIKAHIASQTSRFEKRMSFDFVSGESDDKVILSHYTFSPELGFRLFSFLGFKLNLHFGLQVTPFAQFGVKDLFEVNGWGYGGFGGADFSFKVHKGLHLLGQASFGKTFFGGFSIPETYTTADISPEMNIAIFNAGLAYKY